ncbi:MAG: hypothetical protein Q9227_003052 [Pyrenula ochraceoflavens]
MERISSWLERQASSRHVQLAGAAVLGGVTVAAAILGAQSIRREVMIEDLKASIPNIDDTHNPTNLSEYGAVAGSQSLSKEDQKSAKLAARARRGDYDDDLILEQLARNRVFLTDQGLAKLRASFIIIVGLGGVGSHATAALARSGVTKIRIIDFDQVTLSSLNRHAVATLSDVGTPKVTCMRRRLEQVTPWTKFDCRNELYDSAAAERLLGPWKFEGEEGGKPDYIIDCIDNIDSKVALLHYCHLHSLQVVSSMGAGCKSDPTRICVGDISTSLEDPLSRSTRRRLKILGVQSGIPVVFSTEKPGPGKAALLPLADEEFAKGNVGDLGVLPDFRVRILPVLGTMPAIFGYTAANHVICEISGYPNEYNPGAKAREKMYDGILSTLQGLEESLARANVGRDFTGLRLPLTRDDVGYLVEEVWRGKSAISGLSTRLVLVRWRVPPGGFRPDENWIEDHQTCSRMELHDLVLMTKEEAARHEREVLRGSKNPEDTYEEKVLAIVRRRQDEEKFFEKYR